MHGQLLAGTSKDSAAAQRVQTGIERAKAARNHHAWARCRASWIGCSTKMRDTPPRYVCIHGHFYQPRARTLARDRRGPARRCPYHDRNRRITAECYAANAQAWLLDERGLIARILRTYDRISFNIGPTLLSWLEEQAPRVYQAILAADAESQRRFSGHGSAMAQVYNHVIMPLANRRDQVTQVRPLGAARLRVASVALPKACGCPRPPSICRRCRCWPSTIFATPCWRRTRRAAARRKPDPTRPYRVALPGGARSLCSSTTDRCRGPWRLNTCSAVASAFGAAAWRVSREGGPVRRS